MAGNDFYSKTFLDEHIRSILDFYTDKVCDPTGGYHQNYLDNGELFDTHFKQLVSSTRIIVNYSLAYERYRDEQYKDIALHGLGYLKQTHWQANSLTYAWTLNNHQPEDMTQQAYGYAFVLLAYSIANRCKIIEDLTPIKQTYDLLEERFWQADYALYADEISPSGEMSNYRGQNANMHLCEAMIAAFEATDDNLYLDRAVQLATSITQRQASQTDGLIWEHFTPDFSIDWEYNKDDPKNLYRPWGFQPGHQTEWSKLLLAIHRHRPAAQLIEKAAFLFDTAFEKSWDEQQGGLIYGFDPQGNWCDDDKYFWVQAESFAAAAMLYQATSNHDYIQRYTQLWDYAWQHMVDHQYGAWFRVLTRDNKKYSNQKSAAGAKCDYHTLCACFEVLRVIES